jgi:AcrR family transcriptional regulator
VQRLLGLFLLLYHDDLSFGDWTGAPLTSLHVEEYAPDMEQRTTYSEESHPHSGTRLRADARRNRDQILLAARDVFVEMGPDAPLDAVARRAGVGIGTLYRRFPDREALMRAVVLDVLTRVGEEARAALREEPDAFAALARYMHRALDLRVAAVMPVLVGQISFADEALARVRDAATEPIEEIIRRAQAAGTLRADATFGDVGLMLVRLSRPLPGSFPRALDENLAHRHLDLVIDGLRAGRSPQQLAGPGMTLDALKALSPDAEPRDR